MTRADILNGVTTRRGWRGDAVYFESATRCCGNLVVMLLAVMGGLTRDVLARDEYVAEPHRDAGCQPGSASEPASRLAST
jgi:hypothetical protein